jgi:hypothetical protein
MNTLHILAYILAALFIIRLLYMVYDYYKPSPKKEKFAVANRLMRVPQSVNSETHDVLAYSLGLS